MERAHSEVVNHQLAQAPVVSRCSVNDRRPALAVARRSRYCSRSRFERATRSSFQTISSSPGRSWTTSSAKPDRSDSAPLALSLNSRLQPVAAQGGLVRCKLLPITLRYVHLSKPNITFFVYLK